MRPPAPAAQLAGTGDLTYELDGARAPVRADCRASAKEFFDASRGRPAAAGEVGGPRLAAPSLGRRRPFAPLGQRRLDPLQAPQYFVEPFG